MLESAYKTVQYKRINSVKVKQLLGRRKKYIKYASITNHIRATPSWERHISTYSKRTKRCEFQTLGGFLYVYGLVLPVPPTLVFKNSDCFVVTDNDRSTQR